MIENPINPSGAKRECALPRRNDERLQHISNNTYYAVTIKYNVGPADSVLRCHYEVWVERAIEKGLEVHKMAYEYDSKGRLHIHLLASGRNNMYQKKYVLRGYNQDIQKLNTQEDKFRWEEYLDKATESTYLNMCRREYMFIPDSDSD